MQIPTVKIEAGNKRGFRVINERDFDPKKHKKHGEKPKPKKKAK